MGIYEILSRKKAIEGSSPTKLAKVLSAFDLTALGVGSTLGVGVYVLAGEVAQSKAGPAVIFSFMLAAFASVLAGLCYAEFGARVPRAGSAYVYCYVTVGELIAFVVGWTLILSYSIGAASVVKGLSTYVNALTGMHGYFANSMPINVDGLSPFPDFFAFAVVMLFSAALAFGANESSLVNNIFTVLNVSVVLFVIVIGSFKADPANWRIPMDAVLPGMGIGGFAPYGIRGIMRGAATCFYGFIGFDCIATAGEEAKNPKRSLPIAIIASLFIIFMAYFGISTVLTMMLPYFEQDPNAPLIHVFKHYGWDWAVYVVSTGAIFGLCASLMGSMFPLPRIVYAMSIDGLVFEWMGRVNDRFHTPMWGTLFVGALTAILAAFLDLKQLVNIMSIGTLMAYSVVAACVLLLRYEVGEEEEKINIPNKISSNIWRFFWNSDNVRMPSKLTSSIVTVEVSLFCLVSVLFGLLLDSMQPRFLHSTWWTSAVVVLCLMGAIMLSLLVLISRQPSAHRADSFATPFTPWLPGISIVINICLMMQLDFMTWICFTAWTALGLVVYFSYGIRNSVERKRHAQVAFMNNKQNQSNLFTSSREILVPTGQ